MLNIEREPQRQTVAEIPQIENVDILYGTKEVDPEPVHPYEPSSPIQPAWAPLDSHKVRSIPSKLKSHRNPLTLTVYTEDWRHSNDAIGPRKLRPNRQRACLPCHSHLSSGCWRQWVWVP